MNNHTSGEWDYSRNVDGTYSVYPACGLRDESYAAVIIAEVFTDRIDDPEANARLIASAPEMRVALIAAVEALRATDAFMCGLGLETDDLTGIIGTIDELLDRVDQEG